MASQPIEFDTERLSFRAWQDRHREPFAAMNADAEVMRFFPALVTAEQTNAGIDVWRSQFAEKGWSNWAVELRETGEFIGFIGLSIPTRQLPFSPCVEIGWRMKRSAWGHGYATEGAKACLQLGFARLGLSEIVSFTTLANQPSIAVMQRIGISNTQADFEHPAVPEGHAQRMHCLYKITRAEWLRAAQQAGTPPQADYFRALERQRTQSLIDKDMQVAAALHAPEYQLITPFGKSFTRDGYLGAIQSGDLNYTKWDFGEIDVRLSPGMAIVRSRVQLGFPSGRVVDCWHTDSYELKEAGWQAVWSQATSYTPATTAPPVPPAPPS